MKRERIRSKHGYRGLGKFILGWFIGFLSTFLIIIGIGYWAYTSISVGKVEKWTKSNIAGDNEGIRSLTLQDVVTIAMGVAKGSDDYTLAKFEEDFDLKLFGDSMFGISLDKLKNAPIKELSTALSDTIDSATFNNVLSFMDVEESELGLLKTVLDSKIEYYINNQKLYEDSEYTTEVDFEYTIEGDTIKFSNGSHTISSNTIAPRLRDLPLNNAMSSMSQATEGLKIYEVLGYTREGDGTTENPYIYKDGSIEVTGIMKSLAGYSVGDLSNNETFNGLYIYEVMGYTREGDGTTQSPYVYKDGDTEVSGVLKYLAPSTIGGLSTTINSLTLGQALDVEFEEASGILKVFYDKPINNLGAEIQNMKVYQAMGYYYNETDEKYYQNYDGTTYSNEVVLEGIVKAIAQQPVNNLSNAIDEVKVADVFDRATTPVLNLFVDGDDTSELDALTVMDMPNAVVNKLNDANTTLGDLLDAGVITMDNPPAQDDPVRLLTITGLIELAMTVS